MILIMTDDHLLRSIVSNHSDHLVAFIVVDGDEFGHTLAWRILKTGAGE